MRDGQALRSVVILGGGTAGWSAAALLAKRLEGSGTTITLVESSSIPTVGVGEATIPPIFEFLRFCGIDEVEFIRRTGATMKLGIRFCDWVEPGHAYWHPFGTFGLTVNERPFHHLWWRNVADGGTEELADVCPAIALAEAGKFAFPPPDGAFPGGGLAYALHFDAGLVAAYLREVAERGGVVRLDRRVMGGERDGARHGGEGIAALVLEGGERLEADLFIDCSGFRGMLIEETLAAGYHDWRHWLPCDRAVAAPSRHRVGRPPYTTATACTAGWQWRIPLQHRVGNGYVYASEHLSDEDAAAALLARIEGPAEADPRFLRFVAGHRRRAWVGNCVAIGLSAGFLEPLESTSIHLIHTGLYRLLDYWPDRTMAPPLARAYNREVDVEYAHIRDFLLLHYVPNRRFGEPFWDRMRTLTLPDSLAEKIDLFTASGRIVSRRRELFADISWWFVAVGMGLRPDAHDPFVDIPDNAEIRALMRQLRAAMRTYANAAPTHDALLDRLLNPAETRRPNFVQRQAMGAR